MPEEVVEQDKESKSLSKEEKAEQKRLKKEAKKEAKEAKKEKKKKKKGKGIFKLIFTLILLTVIFIVASFFIVSNNIFGLSEGPLNDILMKVPYVNELLSDGTEGEESKSRADLLFENSTYESEIVKLNSEIEMLNSEITELELELERLTELEDDYLTFRQQKEEFDLSVANNDPINYAEYYAEMYPENAEEIYSNIIQNIEADENVKRYISRFEALDAGTTAEILEELIYTDLNLVVDIIDNMSISKSAEVLENMESANSSTILKRLTP